MLMNNRKLIFLMAVGKRIQAISILGREVMASRGLTGLAYDTLTHCGPELRSALEYLSQSEKYPVMVHCTQGKDRTGLIIALVLFLLDVPEQVVERDYCLSEKELEPEREGRLKEIGEIGLGPEFADAPKGFIIDLHAFIFEKHGSVKEYLQSIGVDEEMRKNIVEILSARKEL
jgi:protein-tyrosine phosphatase